MISPNFLKYEHAVWNVLTGGGQMSNWRWHANFHIFEVNISYAYLSYLSEITVITCRKSYDHDDDTGKTQLSTPYSQQSGGEVQGWHLLLKVKKKMQVISSTGKQDTSCYTGIYTDTCTYRIFEHWNDLSLSASVCEGEGDLGRRIQRERDP